MIAVGFNRLTAKSRDVALMVLTDYGNDKEAYGDRLLEICDGDRKLVEAVERQLYVLSGDKARDDAKREKARKERQERRYAKAA